MEEKENFITIYTNSQLQNIIDKNKEISYSVTIKSEEIDKLNGVKRINGSLSIINSTISSLGELEEINGSFSIINTLIESNITELKNIRLIKGDVFLAYSKIESLGYLEEINGTLNLKNTQSIDLEKLKFIGGNLYLPRKFKNQYNLINILIKGKVKYFKDNENANTLSKPISLTQSTIPIPYWEFMYVSNPNILSVQKKEIRSFYEYYKKSFLGNKFIDLKGSSNYLFTLFLELFNEYEIEKDLSNLESNYEKLNCHYPIIQSYTRNYLINIYIKLKEYQKVLPLLLDKNEYFNLTYFLFIKSKLLNKNVDFDVLKDTIKKDSLTEYGRNNITEIMGILKYKFIESPPKEIDAAINYLSQFDNFHTIKGEKPFIEKLATFLERGLRDSENELREKRGLPKIGEGWINETELYYKIKTKYSDYNVIHHGKPTWLGRQHLDIYIEDLKVGIEYMGSQHYEAIDFFGGKDSLLKTVELDKLKIEKCRANFCKLLIVKEGYLFEEIETKINEIIRNKCILEIIEFPLL